MGCAYGQAYRDREWEEKILEMTRKMGIGAQFGGKYFCHDVRVIRLKLTGGMIVARDIVHARIKERLDAGEDCRII